MNFNDAYSKLHIQIKLLPPGGPDFIKQLLAYSSVLEKLFPVEFKQKLIELNLTKLIEDMNSAAGEMVKEIDYFNLNPNSKTIEVVMGPDSISAPIVDIKNFIETELKLNPSSPDYWFTLSYLTRIENFELFQITHGIILK